MKKAMPASAPGSDVELVARRRQRAGDLTDAVRQGLAGFEDVGRGQRGRLGAEQVEGPAEDVDPLDAIRTPSNSP